MDSKTESKLIALTIKIMSPRASDRFDLDWISEREVSSYITQVMSLISSMDLHLQPKPESEFMSLTTQIISLLHSIDMDSQPKPLSNLIILISQGNFSHLDFRLFFRQTLALEPEPAFMSLIYQIFTLVISMSSKREKLVSLCPQACVVLNNNGKFDVIIKEQEGHFHQGKPIPWSRYSKWECLPFNWKTYWSKGEEATHFQCRNCDGENHNEYNKALVEIKHSHHRKHSLQLVLLDESSYTRVCYCCDEDLKRLFYYCPPCDFSVNFACAKKQATLYIDQPKWHEHTLALFLRRMSLTCNVCALSHSDCTFYMCPPCEFVIHQSCISLPRVIRISRHLHRIAFTFSFDQEDLSCGVCRMKIDNNFGGYFCVKDGCSYAAHSKCATQSNVWDGQELEGEPEEIEEEELEPFLNIGDGVIQHFSHQHHHMRLDENTSRDYDENKQCQACTTPIYFGNFYSCMQCDFILHEECAKLSRKIHHPIHQHLLTLVGGYDGVINFYNDKCSTCIVLCKGGFFYECGKEGCDFMLHVQCATTSEPLVHESHMHPLFLTSKPGEKRRCSVCKESAETFNCIECNFALCFACATLPQKVRYKHDKHALTLSYGEETSTLTSWCEVCEGKVNLKQRFYMCNEYCCITLHIHCMLGDLHMKPASTYITSGKKVDVLFNKHRMSRSVCSFCPKHCSQIIVYKCCGLIFCSRGCVALNRLHARHPKGSIVLKRIHEHLRRPTDGI